MQSFMTHRFIYLLLFFMFPSFLLGQSNFKGGYIINNELDTVHGLLDDRSDRRNSTFVRFKKTVDANIQKYFPKDLIGYKVGNKKYLSKNLSHEAFINGVPTAFAQVINIGIINFYLWKDRSIGEHIYVEKNKVIRELTNETKEVYLDGRAYRKATNEYRQTLKKLTSDCPEELHPDHIEFTKKAISDYITIYNNCKGGENYKASQVNNKTTLKTSVFIGAGFSSITATGQSAKFIETNTRITPSAGVGLHANVPNINNRILVDIFVEYQQKGASAISNNIQFDLHYINLTPGISFNYPKGRIRPVLGAGFVIGFLLNKKTAYKSISASGETERIFDRPNYRNTEVGYELGFQGRAGIEYVLNNQHSILINIKYSITEIPFNLPYEGYHNNLLTVQVGYAFN